MAGVSRMDKLESALIRLADAQARTEAQLEILTGRIDQLAEVQRRTEERLDRLAEAQRRTEEQLAALTARVDQLAEAQRRTEERLDRLAEAQRRTEETVRALAERMDDLVRQVGRLAETIGFTLEDLAREVTPAYLAQYYGIRVTALDRRFFTVDGQEVEVDLYGEGRRDGEVVVVVGEVRSRIHGRDVEMAARQAQRLASQLPGRPVTVLFGFVIHPSAREVAAQYGAVVISSSGRP